MHKLITFLISVMLLAGCNNVATFDDVAAGTTAKIPSSSDISFSGIDSITSVTDTTATVNWTHVAGASTYQVFSVSGGALTFVGVVTAPTAVYSLTALAASSTLQFRVRAYDSSGDGDANTKNVSITTSGVPTIPSGLALQSPATTPAFDDTPTITVSGVKSGDTVKLFTDSSCSTEVGSAVAAGSSVNITSSSIAGTNTFYANSAKTGTSACSGASVSYTKTTCPVGYIEVPSNAAVGATNDFCVMKYEAKNVGGNPSSTAAGNPWVSINQTAAWSQCDDLNSEAARGDIDSDTGSDGTYALISNPEWMAIARNVESNTPNEALNWSGGSVGTGILARGWVTGNNAVAPSTGAGCLYNSAANTCAGAGDLEDKRVLTLSNNEEIWDLSGNVWEWVDWTLGSPLSTNMASGGGGDKPFDATDGAPVASWRELTQIDTFTALAPDTSFEPTDNSFDASFGMGRYYAGTAGGAALRGGLWDGGTYAGAFALTLNLSSGSSSASFGFRCVLRLP